MRAYGFAPLIGLTNVRGADPLDEHRATGIEAARFGDGFGLGRLDAARALRVRTADCVVALRAAFNENFVGHDGLQVYRLGRESRLSVLRPSATVCTYLMRPLL